MTNLTKASGLRARHDVGQPAMDTEFALDRAQRKLEADAFRYADVVAVERRYNTEGTLFFVVSVLQDGSGRTPALDDLPRRIASCDVIVEAVAQAPVLLAED